MLYAFYLLLNKLTLKNFKTGSEQTGSAQQEATCQDDKMPLKMSAAGKNFRFFLVVIIKLLFQNWIYNKYGVSSTPNKLLLHK